MSAGDRPEVAIVYLRNFLVARGNASMGITVQPRCCRLRATNYYLLLLPTRYCLLAAAIAYALLVATRCYGLCATSDCVRHVAIAYEMLGTPRCYRLRATSDYTPLSPTTCAVLTLGMLLPGLARPGPTRALYDLRPARGTSLSIALGLSYGTLLRGATNYLATSRYCPPRISPTRHLPHLLQSTRYLLRHMLRESH
eukprot:1932450-Rhodomonas_salina.12